MEPRIAAYAFLAAAGALTGLLGAWWMENTVTQLGMLTAPSGAVAAMAAAWLMRKRWARATSRGQYYDRVFLGVVLAHLILPLAFLLLILSVELPHYYDVGQSLLNFLSGAPMLYLWVAGISLVTGFLPNLLWGALFVELTLWYQKRNPPAAPAA